MISHLDTSRFIGRIRLWTPEDPRGLDLHNLVTKTGADIVGRLLAGQAEYRLAKFWFEFDNAGSPAAVVPATSDTSASVIAAATGTRDIIAGGLVAAPLLAASAAGYQSNRGSYHAMSQGSVGLVQGLPFGATSKIVALCLVAAPTNGALSSDVIYARAAVSPILAVGSSAQVAATWSTEVT